MAGFVGKVGISEGGRDAYGGEGGDSPRRKGVAQSLLNGLRADGLFAFIRG